MGRIRTQLHQSGLPSFLWGELAAYCSLQINCSPTRALQMHIPILEFEKHIIGHLHQFDFSRLHPFGCRVFAHQQHRPTKLEPTSRSLIFVGLERGARAAQLWDPQTSRILVSGDIVCREDVFPATLTATTAEQHNPPSHVSLIFPSYPDTSLVPDPMNPEQADGIAPSTETVPQPPHAPSEAPVDDSTPETELCPDTEARRSERTRVPVVRYGFSATDHTSPEHDHPTYSQAMRGPESASWR